MKKWILSLLVPIFLIIGFSRVYAETRPENGIYDPQHHLTQETKDKLVNFNTNHDAQLGIYIVDTLGGKNLENFARETAREWKIGYADSNKGALIMIAVKDRKFRIETSNNMATELTDSESRAILENVKPFMRKENYDTAVSVMIDSIEKELTNQERSSMNDQSKSFWAYFQTKDFQNTMIGIIILVILMLISIYTMGAALELVRQDPTLNPYLRHHTASERSQYEYDGYDKLYPNDPDFVKNATWTAALIAAFYAAQAKQNRRRKSTIDDDYHYGTFMSTSHDSKSRTSNKSNSYWSSDDSSSSWSSSDWGGGGFDGGGSSSSW